MCAAALWAWLWHCPVAGPGGWWLGLHTHRPPVQTEAWAAGRLASRARSLFLGDRQEPKEGSDPFRFWLLLRPVVPLGPLSLATGVTSPRPVPPPGPVAMQLGLAGGWRHTDALFCLLGRPGMSERATSFRPRKGPPGAMVFSQFPWKGTATTPCPHLLEAGTHCPGHRLMGALPGGPSAPVRVFGGASTLPGQGSRHSALTALAL